MALDPATGTDVSTSATTTSGSSNTAHGTNNNYLVRVQCPTKGIDVIADLPEELAVNAASEWENRLATSSVSAIPGGGIAAAVAGSDAIIQINTEQMWKSTSPMEIPLSLLFNHKENARLDVFEPMVKLETLVLPTLAGGGFLVTPGPLPGKAAAGTGHPVNVFIGRQLLLMNCIIISVANSFSNRLSKDGYPIAGQSEITIRTNKVLSAEEWRKVRMV